MISSSLFHFTHFDGFKSILETLALRASLNFEPIEDIYSGKGFLAVPMICFCDIPLKFIDEHVHRYGNYAIAFTKEWAIKRSIQPILYRLEHAEFANISHQLIVKQRAIEIEVNRLNRAEYDSSYARLAQGLSDLTKEIRRLGTIAKPYEDNRNNYIDREWRYIDMNYDPEFEFENSVSRKKQLNDRYHNFGIDSSYLNFDLNDIEHIVVSDKSRLNEVLDLIRNLKDSSGLINEFGNFRLAQKVIDLETVKRDI